MAHLPPHLEFATLLLLLPACTSDSQASSTPRSEAAAIALVAHAGDSDLDNRIRARQDRIRNATDDNIVDQFERLGSLFIVKARRSNDNGYYKLAEQTAIAMAEIDPDHAGSLLLRGHVLHSLHDFAAAETIARRLVQVRGLFLDHGLLGDVLLDRGQVREALESYQKMLDLKPCLQSYSRAARVRWLRGDLTGAHRLLSLATGAGSPRAPESLAWTYSRLAIVLLQLDQLEAAERACTTARELIDGYAPALLAQGRILLAKGENTQAIEVLRQAAQTNPLPEYQWFLIEALTAEGQIGEVEILDRAMQRTGAQEDPRNYALYLLSRGREAPRALRLAKQELAQRQDVFTHDLHAWALLANGEPAAAAESIQRALAEGTQDARLFYHAGAIAMANDERVRAKQLLRKAAELRRMLLPSEHREVQRRLATL